MADASIVGGKRTNSLFALWIVHIGYRGLVRKSFIWHTCLVLNDLESSHIKCERALCSTNVVNLYLTWYTHGVWLRHACRYILNGGIDGLRGPRKVGRQKVDGSGNGGG
jgi:hypothetical protein